AADVHRPSDGRGKGLTGLAGLRTQGLRGANGDHGPGRKGDWSGLGRGALLERGFGCLCGAGGLSGGSGGGCGCRNRRRFVAGVLLISASSREDEQNCNSKEQKFFHRGGDQVLSSE